MAAHLRRSILLVFWAWVIFVIAGLGFYGLLDDNPLTALAATHPLLQVCVLAAQAGAVLALLAVAAGGLPIALSALRFALANRRRDVLLLLAVPPVWVVILGVLALALVVVANRTALPPTVGLSLFWSIGALFLVAALASPAAVSAAVVRGQVPERWYRLARVPAAAVVVAMAFTLGAIIAWGVSADLEARQAFWGGLGLLGMNTALSWAGVIAGMGLATLTAAIALTILFRHNQGRGRRSHRPAGQQR